MGSADRDSSSQAFEPAGRFTVLRPLRDDGGISSLLGSDPDTGGHVVLKRVPAERIGETGLRRIERVCRIVKELEPAGVAPCELVIDAEAVYVVSPFVDGHTLAERLARGPLRAAETIAVGTTLLAALSGLHDAGIVHLGVKPSNLVLVPGGVVLLDVALHRAGRSDDARDLPAEAAVYVSPEQAGLVDRPIDQRSDLYSAGIVLYECLAGHPPFVGSSVGEVLRRHLSDQPGALYRPGGATPRALQVAVDHLLRKSPDDRYQTAAAAAADLDDIRRGMAAGRTPEFVPGLKDRRTTLTEPAFVGRDDAMVRLLDALDAATIGEGGLVRLEAESGLGKSRLLAEFTHSIADRAWVLRGEGIEHGGRRPYGVLADVATAAAVAARHDEALAHDIAARIAEDADSLRSVLPELGAVLGPHRLRAAPGPEEYGERRVVRALSSFLDALGSPERPAIVVIDDGQWAGDVIMTLLEYWCSAREGPRHVMVVVSRRPADVASRTWRRLPGAHVELERLSAADVKRMAESMAGRLPAEALEAIVALSDGVPFMTSAVVHGMVESGAIAADGEGWTVTPGALDEVRSSSHAATLLARRLDLLPPATLRLLEAAAVLGKQFELNVAADLSGHSRTEAGDAYEEARRRHIVWGGPSTGRPAAFVHDRLRSALLDQLPAADRRRLHRDAAALIEAADPSKVFDLAYHYDRAGEAPEAMTRALEAARLARGRYALEVAEDLYAIASRSAEASGAGDDVRAQIARETGDVLMLHGRYALARRAFEDALSLTTRPNDRAAVEARLAELAFKRGDLKASGTITEQALRSLGKRAPKRFVLLFAVWEILVQVAHTVLGRIVVGRRPAEGAELDRLAMRLYSRLAHVSWFTRGSVPTLWAHLREMNLAERYQPTPELAQAYSEHAPALALLGWWSRGRDYVERSLKIRTDMADDWGRGQSLNFYGVLLYNAARLDEAVERLTQAERLLERTGDRWELNIARLNKALALYRLGRLREAEQIAHRIHRDGLEIGDPQASGIGLEILAKVTGGEVDASAIATELDRDTYDMQTHTEVMQAEAVRLLALGRHAEAAAVLQEATRKVRSAGLRNEYVASIRPWLASALRLQAESTESFARGRRRALARRASRAARRARLTSLTYRCNRPHALRESALVDGLRGRRRRARRRIDASIRTADALSMRHEHAQSLLARARLGRSYGWAHTDEDERRAGAELRDIFPDPFDEPVRADPATTLSLADRFEAILEAGRNITTALSPEAIYAAAREAGVTILRAQRAEIVGIERLAAGDTSLRTLLSRRALDARRPAVASAGGGDDLAEAATLAHVRSALAAPVFVRGRPVACLYVDHEEVGGLFGPDEVRLAGFVGTLAGAALENAEGFSEVRDLSRSLEKRVAERTAQLTETNRALDASLRQLQEALERERDIAQKLRELDELRSDFLSTVSHELRTPLTSIAGFSETLLHKWEVVADDMRRDFVGRIANNAAHLDQLISELLDFSRLERGKLKIELRPVELVGAVAETADKLGRVLDAHEVEVGIADDLVALADPQALARILENLLSNAAKFSPEGTTVTVAATATADTITLTVSDQGIGIPKEEVDRIFERFYRVHRADDAARGTGIGLAIVKQFVEAQGGHVWVQSEVGRGTTFGFTLLRGPAPGEVADQR